MEINTLSNIQDLLASDFTQMPPRIPQGENPFESGMDGIGANISPMGKMLSTMSEEDRAEMQAFHEEMKEAVESGTFDAAEMAENAPEALKTFAEENGIDLEEMLTDMAERGGPPPTPPIGYDSNGAGILSSSQDVTMETLLQMIADEDSETDTVSFLTGA